MTNRRLDCGHMPEDCPDTCSGQHPLSVFLGSLNLNEVAIRDQAFEEAARVCDRLAAEMMMDHLAGPYESSARSIRVLKGTPPSPVDAVDWDAPIETADGRAAKYLPKFGFGPRTIEIGNGRFAYNDDGTPLSCHGFMPHVHNVPSPDLLKELVRALKVAQLAMQRGFPITAREHEIVRAALLKVRQSKGE